MTNQSYFLVQNKICGGCIYGFNNLIGADWEKAVVRMTADTIHYLDGLLDAMSQKWPDNRTINIVCHGHSAPAGYFATPFVNTFEAYPALLTVS
jgi:hypothetical protein